MTTPFEILIQKVLEIVFYAILGLVLGFVVIIGARLGWHAMDTWLEKNGRLPRPRPYEPLSQSTALARTRPETSDQRYN